MTLDQHEVGQLVMDALAHGISGDSRRAADALTAIGDGCDANMLYGACCAIAEAGKHMLHQIYGHQAPRPGSADMYVLEQLEPGTLDGDPVKAFAARFLVAYCNGDHEATLALYGAAAGGDPDVFVESVCALLADVCGISRLVLGRRSAP